MTKKKFYEKPEWYLPIIIGIFVAFVIAYYSLLPGGDLTVIPNNYTVICNDFGSDMIIKITNSHDFALYNIGIMFLAKTHEEISFSVKSINLPPYWKDIGGVMWDKAFYCVLGDKGRNPFNLCTLNSLDPKSTVTLEVSNPSRCNNNYEMEIKIYNYSTTPSPIGNNYVLFQTP